MSISEMRAKGWPIKKIAERAWQTELIVWGELVRLGLIKQVEETERTYTKKE